MPISKNPTIIVNNFVTQSVTQSAGDHGSLSGLGDNDHLQYTLTSSFNPVSESHALVSASHVLVSSAYVAHAADATIHFTEASIDHGSISGLGDLDHPQYTLTSSFIPVSESHALVSASHALVSAAYVAHAADATIHFTEASIDHTAISNIGTNDHAAIDSHIADGLIHYASGAIVHNDLSGLATGDPHTQYLLADGSRNLGGDLNLGGFDLSNGGVVSAEVTGSLTRTGGGTSFIIGAGGLTTSTGSNGQVTIDATDLSSSIETDIGTNTTSITDLSGVVASDVNDLRWIGNTLDSSGDRTLSDGDNNTVIYMSGASANILRVPPTLTDGFHCVAHQASATNILVVATNSLYYPSTTFTSRSLEEGASVALHSGSFGIILGGILESV